MENNNNVKRYFDENGNEIFIREENSKPEKKGIKYYLNSACQFIRENKDVFIILTPIVLSTNKLIKTFKPTDTYKTYEDRSYYYYDPHTGIRWRLKKPLTNAQNEQIMARRRQGEDIYVILSSMRCLK